VMQVFQQAVLYMLMSLRVQALRRLIRREKDLHPKDMAVAATAVVVDEAAAAAAVAEAAAVAISRGNASQKLCSADSCNVYLRLRHCG
jgi:hypothetical protein